ncbi:MAG: hypothetical protein ACE5DX_05250 [Candidatus Dojkabacteria bacterium]
MKKIFVIGTILSETQYFVDAIPKRNTVSIANDAKFLTSSNVLNAARIMAVNHEVSYLGFVGNDDRGVSW